MNNAVKEGLIGESVDGGGEMVIEKAENGKRNDEKMCGGVRGCMGGVVVVVAVADGGGECVREDQLAWMSALLGRLGCDKNEGACAVQWSGMGMRMGLAIRLREIEQSRMVQRAAHL